MEKTIEKIYNRSPVFLQNLLITTYGYNLYRKRYLGDFQQILKEIAETASLSASKVESLQDEKFRAIIEFCHSHVPYYQNSFSDHGLSPSDFTSISDIRKLPILTKKDVVENSTELMAINSGPAYAVQHTSGSTGTPLALKVDEYTYKLAMALLVDHEQRHGVDFGSRRATFAGRMIKPANDIKPPFSRFNRSENQRLFSSYHINEYTFPHYRKELDSFQPVELIGYPSAISDLADHYLKSDSKPGFRPKVIITNSETLLLWQREKIESVFGCPVYDYYGTAEYVMFAGQDKTGIYRPNPIIGITEVEIDSDSNDTGRLLATSLTNKQMPLLRYNLGDTATLANSTEAAIGTPGLNSINGRIDDYIETSDGRLIGRIDHIFKGVDGIREAQVVQSQPGWATIKLVKNQSTAFNECTLISNCKQRLGDDFRVVVEQVSEIPRGRNGKFRSVIREK